MTITTVVMCMYVLVAGDAITIRDTPAKGYVKYCAEVPRITDPTEFHVVSPADREIKK